MEDVMPFVVASLVIILVILLSIRMQISTMEGLNDLTVENNERLGYKAAGSFHILNQGDRVGVLTEDQYSDMAQNCAQSVSGFSGDPLTLGDAGCSEVRVGLPVPLQIIQNGNVQNRQMKVGETSEGIN